MTTITGMTADKINSLVAIQPITKQVLAAGAASVTFSAIPATFNHLKLRVAHPAFAVADYDLVRLNGDAGVGDYYSAGAGGAASATTPGFPPFKTTSTTVPCGFEIDVLSIQSTAMAKPMLSKSSSVGAVTEVAVSGGWTLAQAVTSITIVTAGGQLYPTGSEFYLYGVL